jgi:acetyltransferase-like isoleucine patch superfamily enzyme
MDLIILDGAQVTIGTRVLCGPRVGLFSATHSTDVDERQGGFERAYPIEIGDDCWIGGGAIINGPSKIGKGCTVAAGAVVSYTSRGRRAVCCALCGQGGDQG